MTWFFSEIKSIFMSCWNENVNIYYREWFDVLNSIFDLFLKCFWKTLIPDEIGLRVFGTRFVLKKIL
jgi:hypothetical protein